MKKDFNFFEIQKEVQNLWEEEKIYTYKKNSNKKIFSIDTPPPTVSGKLHIGHIFSYTQTDIIARYKRKTGYNVLYPFGFDDNGLPTERFVEKKREVSAHKEGRQKFNEICLEETKIAAEIFTELWKKIGLSVDWNLCYSTISEETQKISQKNFIDLYKKDYIYKKKEPALYCTQCRTTVAQAELENIEKETWFSTIIFKKDNNDILVATTRPELLPSCVALLIHPDDIRYQNLIGTFATVPLYNFLVPILSDDKVLPEKGTGIVMCCTFGDTLDIYWFKKHHFEYKETITKSGKIKEDIAYIGNLTITQAREKIIQELENNHLLIEKKKIVHGVSIYERSKKEIEYIMEDQWFLKIVDYKKDLINLANEINWFPEHMKYRYINWVENLEWDWCLSRQRSFGIPFPVWYDKQGNIILANVSELPVDPLKDKPLSYNGEVTPDRDVMDTWNTSSLSPFLVKELAHEDDTFIPISMRPQAHDIIRTWAFYTIVKSFFTNGSIPWKDIVISGHVQAEGNQKISKSTGNSPLDVDYLTSKYCADVIRYWTASSTIGTDTIFSETQIKNGNKLIVKLYNAALFINEHGSKEISNQIEHTKESINQWILESFNNTYETYTMYFEKYEFSLALQSIEQFFFKDFCDNYLELIKGYFFNPEKYDPITINEIKKIASSLFYNIISLFSTFIPFITEYIYREIYDNNDFLSLHHIEKFSYSLIEHNFEPILDLVGHIRKEKTNAKISLKGKIKILYIESKDEKLKNIIEANENLIKSNFNIDFVVYDSSKILMNESISIINNEVEYIIYKK